MDSEKTFTPAQVESFNAYQKAGVFHPFTCGTKGKHVTPFDDDVLIANEQGLYCPSCDYTQDWCHGFMADGSWKHAVVNR